MPRSAIGDEAFVRRVESRHAALAASGKRREDVVLRRCREFESVESAIADLCGKLGVAEADVIRSGRDGTDRGIVALALIRRSGLTQRDAAVRLGLASGSAVGYLVGKVKSCANRNSALRQQLECIPHEFLFLIFRVDPDSIISPDLRLATCDAPARDRPAWLAGRRRPRAANQETARRRSQVASRAIFGSVPYSPWVGGPSGQTVLAGSGVSPA